MSEDYSTCPAAYSKAADVPDRRALQIAAYKHAKEQERIAEENRRAERRERKFKFLNENRPTVDSVVETVLDILDKNAAKGIKRTTLDIWSIETPSGKKATAAVLEACKRTCVYHSHIWCSVIRVLKKELGYTVEQPPKPRSTERVTFVGLTPSKEVGCQFMRSATISIIP